MTILFPRVIFHSKRISLLEQLRRIERTLQTHAFLNYWQLKTTIHIFFFKQNICIDQLTNLAIVFSKANGRKETEEAFFRKIEKSAQCKNPLGSLSIWL